jgi:hypothetical protein
MSRINGAYPVLAGTSVTRFDPFFRFFPRPAVSSARRVPVPQTRGLLHDLQARLARSNKTLYPAVVRRAEEQALNLSVWEPRTIDVCRTSHSLASFRA